MCAWVCVCVCVFNFELQLSQNCHGDCLFFFHLDLNLLCVYICKHSVNIIFEQIWSFSYNPTKDFMIKWMGQITWISNTWCFVKIFWFKVVQLLCVADALDFLIIHVSSCKGLKFEESNVCKNQYSFIVRNFVWTCTSHFSFWQSYLLCQLKECYSHKIFFRTSNDFLTKT